MCIVDVDKHITVVAHAGPLHMIKLAQAMARLDVFNKSVTIFFSERADTVSTRALSTERISTETNVRLVVDPLLVLFTGSAADTDVLGRPTEPFHGMTFEVGEDNEQIVAHQIGTDHHVVEPSKSQKQHSRQTTATTTDSITLNICLPHIENLATNFGNSSYKRTDNQRNKSDKHRKHTNLNSETGYS